MDGKTPIPVAGHDSAETWFVRMLEPDASDADRQAFERWLTSDPGHTRAYREIEAIWRQSGIAAQDPVIQALARQALDTGFVPQTGLRRWWVPAVAVAATVLLAFLVVPRWLAKHSPGEGMRYLTAVGEQRTVTLPDGSVMVLDTDTLVVERYRADQRRLDLVHGQAEFRVQGNKARPFVTYAQGGSVTAVGTRFQVRTDAAQTAVTLLEGQVDVAVTSGAGPHRASLMAMQQLSFDQTNGIGPVQRVDPQQALNWIEGRVVAHNWRLADLIAEMNRYTATQVELGDTALAELRISGVFHAGDQQSLLQSLEQGWPVQATRISPERVLLSRK